MQYAAFCDCGDKYGVYGAGTGCDMPCTGDDTQICGAGMKNTILKIHIGKYSYDIKVIQINTICLKREAVLFK